MKRIISIILALILVFASVPIVFAADEGTVVLVELNDIGFTQFGVWRTEEEILNERGIMTKSATAEDAYCEWRPEIKEPGNYTVYVWKAIHPQATDVTLTVNTADASNTVVLDYSTGEAQWVDIGTYYFDAGIEGNVHGYAPQGTTMLATPIKFVNPQATAKEEIVDYGDSKVISTVEINNIYVEYDETDATENIRAALNEALNTPGRDRVILRNPGEGKKWISDSLWIKSNTELYLEAGAVLESKSGAFDYSKKGFILVDAQENVSIIGEDRKTSQIKMLQHEYTEGEWRHAISVNGSKNIIIKNLTIYRGGGDGININRADLLHGSAFLGPCENVLIEDVTIDGASRNNISLVAGINVLINRCSFLNAGRFNPSGVASNGPWAGIDMEPEADAPLNHVKVYNCLFENNKRSGISINMAKLLVDMGEPQYIDIKGCTFHDDRVNMNIINKTENIESYVNIEDCYYGSSGYTNISSTSWSDNGLVKIKNSVFSYPFSIDSFGLFTIKGDKGYDMGGFEYDNIYVFNPMASAKFFLFNNPGDYSVSNITGTIYTDVPQPEFATVDTKYENFNVTYLKPDVSRNEALTQLFERMEERQKEAAELSRAMQEDFAKASVSLSDKVSPVEVTLDGEHIKFSDQEPVLINNRVLVPMRTIFEAAGAEVEWDETAQKVTAKKSVFTIDLTVGSNVAYKDGVAMSLDVAPILINGTTMVPLRFIGESLGYKVSWEHEAWMVVLNKIPTDPQKISNGEIIVDCTTVGFELLGADWKKSSILNHDGSELWTSTYVQLTERYTPKIIYTPQITESGMYDIYIYKSAAGRSDPTVGFELVYDTNVTLDPELPIQNWQEGKSGWVKLTEETGPLFFSEQTANGSQHVLVKRTTNARKSYTRATAVKFVKVK